jgi:ribose 5-phosphate isomerase A
MDIEAQKRAAAARAVEFVRPGMRLGLGSGSTAKHFVELLAERVRAGLDVIAVPTSETTRSDAERLGVPLTTLDETPQLDLVVDGADEIGPDLSLIKGGGGALLGKDGGLRLRAHGRHRRRLEAVSAPGRFPLPTGGAFGLRRPGGRSAAAGPCQLRWPALLRQTRDDRFRRGWGHWIRRCLGRIGDQKSLADHLGVTGVVEHGLLIDSRTWPVLADANGVRVVERPRVP